MNSNRSKDLEETQLLLGSHNPKEVLYMDTDGSLKYWNEEKSSEPQLEGGSSDDKDKSDGEENTPPLISSLKSSRSLQGESSSQIKSSSKR